jgi:activator of 2-hydroxyglutaryl-CoA dehydratase
MEEMIGRRVLVPEHPQLTGALGAALYALES